MRAHDQLADVTIIGGGIIGCALAWELAVRGVKSQILERREIAREASWASAGIISPPSERHGTRAELALRSFRRYPSLIAEIEERTGLSVGYVSTGELDAGHEPMAGQLRATMDWQVSHGLKAEWIDASGVREREPALGDHLSVGVFTPEAGSVILARMTQALARAAVKLGATVREHTPVLSVNTREGRATSVRTVDREIGVGTLVIAAGAWSRALGESLDFSIPTVPVRGQMLSIADPPIPIRSVVSAGGGYFVPRADGTIAVGATEEHDAGFDVRVTPVGVSWLTDLVKRVAPSLGNGRLQETWAGLRPATEDGELIVGRVPHLENVWIATGHYRSGALLAPGTAEALAASIINGAPEPALAPFDPARFR